MYAIPYERLKALLDSSLDVICSFDKEGRFIDANIAALKVWGYHPEELRGRFYINMVVEEDRAKTIQAATDITSGIDMTNFENRYYCKDGSIMPIVWSARWDAANEVMYCVARNASEKKEAEEKIKEAERRTHQSRQVFELFMKNSPLVAWITDIGGVMQYMNPTYLETYGLTEEHIGKSIYDIFDKATAHEYFQNNLKVIYNNQSIETIEHAQALDGSPQILKIIKFPIFQGSVVMCGGWAIDITPEAVLKKQLEENLERYRLVNEATSDLIYDWDIANDIITRTGNYAAMFGYNELTITFEQRLSRIHPDDAARVKASISHCIIDGRCTKWIEQYRYRHHSGQYRNVIDKGFIVRKEDKVIRVIGAIQDVTEQQQIHDEQVELNKNKDRLMSIIAHDLRSPLSGCVSFIDYIIDEYNAFSKEEVIDNLKMVRKNTQNAIDLLQELLLWAQNQMQRVACNFQPINPKAEISHVLEAMKKQCEDKAISVSMHTEAGTEVETDPDMFRSIVRNLLSNAIKFSPAGSTISISGTRGKSGLVVSVTDQGVGMSEILRHELLNGKNVKPCFGTKGEKGIGVGLSLTQSFIEKCGGKMNIESEVGKGSSFSFVLPCKN